jgi:hypothetical protein
VAGLVKGDDGRIVEQQRAYRLSSIHLLYLGLLLFHACIYFVLF